MKKLKKAAALLLTGALLAGSVSAMFTASAATTETIGNEDVLGNYQNDFNGAALTDLADDFSFFYDSSDNTNGDGSPITNDESSWGLDAITAEQARSYIDIFDGKIQRKDTDSSDNNTERFCYRQLYMYYKNQSFSNFEMNITVTPSPQTVNMIHFAPQCDSQSSIYKNGFTLAFLAGTGSNGITMWLGDDTDARTALSNWNIGTSGTNAVSTQNSKNEYASYQFKIKFENGVASVYVDGAEKPALKREGLAEGNYYASVVLGKVKWGKTTVDDFSIKEIVPEVVVDRLEEKGKYLNCFGAGDLAAVLGDDFALRYDHEGWVSAEASTELSVSKAENYLTIENGALRRKRAAETEETGIWEGVRPYWQQVYLYYKKQSFRNFEFSVDLQFSPASFTEIRFSPYTQGTIYSSGFTFAVKADGKDYKMILGDYKEMESNLTASNGNNWIIAESVSQYVFNEDAENLSFNIRITFDNGTANVYLNGGADPVLTRSGLQRVDYYPSIALGVATDWGPTIVDNFSITELDNICDASAEGNGAKMVLREVNNIKEVGFKVTTANGDEKVFTDYANKGARGKLPFKVVDGVVYYFDIDLDGVMGETDFAKLRTYLLNDDEKLVDLNKDDKTDILDLVIMKKVIASVDTVEATEGRYTYYFILPEGAKKVIPYFIKNDDTEITGEEITLS